MCLIEYRSIRRLVQLHNLCSLARVRIVTQGLPFKPDLCKGTLYIRISLNFSCGIIFQMEQFESNVCAVNSPPDEIDYLLDRLLEFRHI